MARHQREGIGGSARSGGGAVRAAAFPNEESRVATAASRSLQSACAARLLAPRYLSGALTNARAFPVEKEIVYAAELALAAGEGQAGYAIAVARCPVGASGRSSTTRCSMERKPASSSSAETSASES